MTKSQVDGDVVRQLAGLLDETGLTEIEYATNTLRVRVAKNHAPALLPAIAPAASNAGGAAAPSSAPPASLADHPGAVTSPMVGTAYVAAEPGAPAFVNVGDTVRVGQTLLIIEAMKVMNPLASPRAGKVKEIMVRDTQPIEFGEVLLVIE
jgi:acetyl-CoA carboxylase biotin carboxyl carrier protein